MEAEFCRISKFEDAVGRRRTRKGSGKSFAEVIFALYQVLIGLKPLLMYHTSRRP